MEKLRYFTKEKENELRMLPRWAKAFFAARTARRAIELIDGNVANPNFIEVVKTLDEVERSIEEGKKLGLKRGDISPARDYAESLRNTSRHQNRSDYYAALAVDDACGLVTNIATTGRGRESADDYQLRKISFAIGCAIQASHGAQMMTDFLDNLYKDFELLGRAVKK